MATYTGAPKVNAAIAPAAGTGASGTLYTAPADGYAIVNIMVTALSGTSGSGTLTVSVAGKVVASADIAAAVFRSICTMGTSGGSSDNRLAFGCAPIHVGPSQAVTYAVTGGASGHSVQVSGVEFVNQS